jgi:HSP20 family protein
VNVENATGSGHFPAPRSSRRSSRQHGSFEPMLDVTEGSRGFHVSVELPGVDEEDLSIEVRGNQMILRGIKRGARDDVAERPFFRERAFGRFERRILLPSELDGSRVATSFSQGVLTVALLKKSSSAEDEGPGPAIPR